MIPRILYRYISKELIRAFLLSLFILTMVFFLVISMRMVTKYSQYISFLDWIALSPYICANAFSLTIPLALLAATTLTYGRMSQDKEILILRTAGIHTQEILKPALLIGLFLSGICFYLNSEIVPLTVKKQKEIKFKALEVLLEASFSSRETSIDFIPGIRIYYQALDNGEFKHLIIQQINNEMQVIHEILADRGKLLYDKTKTLLTFDLKNVSLSHITPQNKEKKEKEERFFFDRFTLPVPLTAPKMDTNKNKYKDFSALAQEMQELYVSFLQLEEKCKATENPQEKKKYQAQRDEVYAEYIDYVWRWHSRIALSLGPLLIVFLGTSLGLLIQHSNRLVGFAISSLPIVLVYYPLDILGEVLVERCVLHPIMGAWISTCVTASIGFILLWILYKK